MLLKLTETNKSIDYDLVLPYSNGTIHVDYINVHANITNVNNNWTKDKGIYLIISSPQVGQNSNRIWIDKMIYLKDITTGAALSTDNYVSLLIRDIEISYRYNNVNIFVGIVNNEAQAYALTFYMKYK